MIDIIDSHAHLQTLSWNDNELLAMLGYKGVVLIATNYHWTPRRPVPPEDVIFLWDYALKWSNYAEKAHGYRCFVATAIHTLSYVSDVDKLLKKLPEYLKNEKVVAVGEFGLEPTPYGMGFPPEEQKMLVRRQLEIAKDAEKPVIIHTPTHKTKEQGAWDEALLVQSVKWPEAKIEATENSLQLVKDVGIDPEKVVIDHVEDATADLVLGRSKAYCAFSVGIVWRKVSADIIAKYVKKYGSDRIIINTDLVGNAFIDIFAIPRLIRDLKRRGIHEKDIRKMVFDNPNKVFGLNL